MVTWYGLFKCCSPVPNCRFLSSISFSQKLRSILQSFFCSLTLQKLLNCTKGFSRPEIFPNFVEDAINFQSGWTHCKNNRPPAVLIPLEHLYCAHSLCKVLLGVRFFSRSLWVGQICLPAVFLIFLFTSSGYLCEMVWGLFWVGF